MEVALTEASVIVGINHKESELVTTLQTESVAHGLIRVSNDDRHESLCFIVVTKRSFYNRKRTHSHLILIGGEALSLQRHKVVDILQSLARSLNLRNLLTSKAYVLRDKVRHRVRAFLDTFERMVNNLLHLRVGRHDCMHDNSLNHLLISLRIRGRYDLTHNGFAVLLVNGGTS